MDETHGDVYNAENLRPLSVVGCFNRIIASAFRFMLVNKMDQIVGKEQRGFMKGRQIIENVLEVDYEYMKVCLNSDKGALILFDFTAAFPSVSHDYLWAALASFGVPEGIIRAFKVLYTRNTHLIRTADGIFESVTVTSGVRQGCPLSPLLFLLAIEPLLHKLTKDLPHCTFRAYADDIGGIVKDLPTDGTRIIAIFEEFATFSGLQINMRKTVVVPAKVDINDEVLQIYADISSQILVGTKCCWPHRANTLDSCLAQGLIMPKHMRPYWVKFKRGWDNGATTHLTCLTKSGSGMFLLCLCWAMLTNSILGTLRRTKSLTPFF